MKMKSIAKFMSFIVIVCWLSSCQKFLDERPDKSQVIPLTMEDCQALLNNAGTLGAGYPVSLEISSDDYYLLPATWETLTPDRRDPYLWKVDANVNLGDWLSPYNRVLVANQVIETLEKIKPTEQQQSQWNSIKGAALLLRSIYFYGLAQEFTQPYNVSTATQNLGIPIRLTPSISDKTERGTLQQTYDRILQDFTEAAALLPAIRPEGNASRSVAMPVKAAAYAALARVYLTMGEYSKAYENADACLKAYNSLMDYNIIDSSPFYPIPRFNEEVLYEVNTSGFVPIFRGIVNLDVNNLYGDGDLRKMLLFMDNGNNTYKFRGTYGQRGEVFTGLSTAEVYLIRAECAARAGNIAGAINDLNTLRKSRWNNDNPYEPLDSDNAEDALKLTLRERQKELPFRGLRWTDLRRLNSDSRFAVTLRREMNGQQYELRPNDLRYTLLIPREILERVGIPQNPR